jgi:hypothetical protein
MRSLLCLLLLIAPAPARADIFDDLSGSYGTAFREDLSCARAPHRVSFSSDRRRAHFVLSSEISDYQGQPRRRADYTVLGLDAEGIEMVLDGETRLTAEGRPVIWVLRKAAGIDGYCWGRTDWPPGRCQHLNLRCKDDLPLG